MKQTVGNVGVLNLLNATEQSVQAYEKIGNVGLVLYRSGQSHLLAALNIGNIGKTVEVPEQYSYYNGTLDINKDYLDSIDQPVKMVLNGMLIIAHDVEPAQLHNGLIDIIVNGEIYTPSKFAGQVSQLFSGGSRTVTIYDGAPPRFENGSLTLSNAFLKGAEEPLYIVVNGLLTIPKDMDEELFKSKIKKIAVNGMVSVHEEQEALLHSKMDSAPNGVIDVIPAGYRVLKKVLRINSRSIKSFRNEKLMTKKPVIFEADVPREALENSIDRIDSKSFIVCSEEIEDLIYEKLERLETEVLSYTKRFVLIEGDEQWSNSQFESLQEPISLIVDGHLAIGEDVTGDAILNKLETLDIFGEVQVASAELIGILQGKIRANAGRISLQQEQEAESRPQEFKNIGELSL